MLTEREKTRKTWLEKAIYEIQKVQLEGLGSGAQTLAFGGRSIQRFTPQELESLRRSYDNELARLERKEVGKSSRTIRVWG